MFNLKLGRSLLAHWKYFAAHRNESVSHHIQRITLSSYRELEQATENFIFSSSSIPFSLRHWDYLNTVSTNHVGDTSGLNLKSRWKAFLRYNKKLWRAYFNNEEINISRILSLSRAVHVININFNLPQESVINPFKWFPFWSSNFLNFHSKVSTFFPLIE